ncbi:polyphosphate kinase 2 family protein [Pseudonocardia sp. WMMC193]|uniref:polyphosphate kinase 2 family protein n=1 Tax=Pseudonocardia sp. WMMC193 TaxID=2911965 RepID=UPI001F16671B|nr:polyphosphate kinase 2 family protein [Pseudonocardia sp. WMMC193]MCF7548491.1 polyphosphate kinase 2 family protein [Pseudonocardia sp. WMMC193]
MASVRETLRVPKGPVDLEEIDPRGTPVGPTRKAAAADEMADLGVRLDTLQEALYAEGTGGGTRAVLLVLQGMDTSGKGGVIHHAVGLVNPQGVQIASFKRPTAEELAHDFLWRIRKQVPVPGRIGVFDRSHYEDVLVARVDSLVPEEVWQARYAQITAFEQELTGRGVTVVKCMLHISPQEQAERLLARLDDPTKRWKYNPGDLDTRAKWPAYQEAYEAALERCDADAAPWYVIPSDRKWYRNWAVAAILAETLEDMAPVFPPPDFDVEEQRALVRASLR